ncbi:recombinase family protein [Enterococcus sp. HY326]|uniref:recombinase family protein n=1 Tax=Enterococcus sp. HY326 TaxID=2971265 RepID=UPI00223FEAD0|nr:recombinase family protein [Enterococcus sp. HY326]
MTKKKKIERKIIKVGYCRVSTDDKQEMSLENQIAMMKERNCDYIFSENGSGRNDNRPEFKKMLKCVFDLAEDENNQVYLIVFKNDRFSRRFRTLITYIDDLIDAGVNYVSIVENIDTSSIGGMMFFQILSSFNEYEVNNTRERVLIGLERAKMKGKKLGRPKISQSQFNKLIRLYQLNSLTVDEIARRCKIKSSTAYKYLRQANIQRRR